MKGKLNVLIVLGIAGILAILWKKNQPSEVVSASTVNPSAVTINMPESIVDLLNKVNTTQQKLQTAQDLSNQAVKSLNVFNV